MQVSGHHRLSCGMGLLASAIMLQSCGTTHLPSHSLKAGGTQMMFIPQGNGSVSAVPVSTGPLVERSVDNNSRYRSGSGSMTLSAKVVESAFNNQRIAAYNEESELNADYEPSPVSRYSAARCHHSLTNLEYTCQFRVRYRYSRKWHAVEHQFRSLSDGRWIVTS